MTKEASEGTYLRAKVQESGTEEAALDLGQQASGEIDVMTSFHFD